MPFALTVGLRSDRGPVVLCDFSKSIGNWCIIGTMEADFREMFPSSRKRGVVHGSRITSNGIMGPGNYW